jgi:hypothetical protein
MFPQMNKNDRRDTEKNERVKVYASRRSKKLQHFVRGYGLSAAITGS